MRYNKYTNNTKLNRRLLLLLCLSFNGIISFGCTKPVIEQGISLGSIKQNYTDKNIFFTTEILKYYAVDNSSGLGVSLHLFSFNPFTEFRISEMFKEPSVLGVEGSWELFYKNKSPFGVNLFYKINSIFSKNILSDSREGIRFSYRLNDIYSKVPYPLISLEIGYGYNTGVYGTLSFDILFGLFGAWYSYLEEELSNIPQ